jgi:thiosulfate/3-mercaptopyruvate sulfurtransferase
MARTPQIRSGRYGALMESSELVSTEWLAAHIGAPDIRIVDASWHLPNSGRDAAKDYAAEHIPGAVFFDIDNFSDAKSAYPHMLPPAHEFAAKARALGLGDGHKIIAYDTVGIFSAARVWWMFKAMGHEDVAVLDGGLLKWKKEGRPVTTDVPQHTARHFTPRPNHALVRSVEQVLANTESGKERLVDVRSAERFEGRAPEPRPGVRSGHVPGSVNLPYKELLTAEGTLQPKPALEAKLAAHGLSGREPIIASCGSGVTASILALAVAELGIKRVSLYDGSWAEWGSRNDLPLATGK